MGRIGRRALMLPALGLVAAALPGPGFSAVADATSVIALFEQAAR